MWDEHGEVMKAQMNFMFFQQLASASVCALPEDTVKLTPPALTTCEGTIIKSMSVKRCLRTCMHARRMLCVQH